MSYTYISQYSYNPDSNHQPICMRLHSNRIGVSVQKKRVDGVTINLTAHLGVQLRWNKHGYNPHNLGYNIN